MEVSQNTAEIVSGIGASRSVNKSIWVLGLCRVYQLSGDSKTQTYLFLKRNVLDRGRLGEKSAQSIPPKPTAGSKSNLLPLAGGPKVLKRPS